MLPTVIIDKNIMAILSFNNFFKPLKKNIVYMIIVP